MTIGTRVHVGDGTVIHREGCSFGGFTMLSPEGGEPAEVIIAVWSEGTDSARFRLSLGQTFEFSGKRGGLTRSTPTLTAGTPHSLASPNTVIGFRVKQIVL